MSKKTTVRTINKITIMKKIGYRNCEQGNWKNKNDINWLCVHYVVMIMLIMIWGTF